jgi:sugar lactone lactonase YvrE
VVAETQRKSRRSGEVIEMSERMLGGSGRRGLTAAAGLALLVALSVPHGTLAGALSMGDSEVQIVFEPPQFPDTVAVNKRGDVLVSFVLGGVWNFTAGAAPSLVCDVDFSRGLAVKADGDAYVVGVRLSPTFLLGVYRLPRDGGPCTHLPGTDQIAQPNALAFDKVGNLYVTDHDPGRIYRISPGGTVDLWLEDPLLAPVPLPGDPGFVVGANGIQYWQGSLLVANTTQRSILRVPILPEGSPGPVAVLYDVAANPGGPVFFPDGLALDVHGNVYAADAISSQIVRVSADGSYAEILAAAYAGHPLDSPTSLAFGTGKGNRKNLFVTNSGLIGPSAMGMPSLIRIGTEVPGNPVP